MGRSIEEILDELETSQSEGFYGQDALGIALDEAGIPRAHPDPDPATVLEPPEHRDDPAAAKRVYARVTFDRLIEKRPGEFDPRALGVPDEDVADLRSLIDSVHRAWFKRYGHAVGSKKRIIPEAVAPYYPWDYVVDS